MSKFLDMMDKFFWTIFRIGFWIFMLVFGWLVGNYIHEKYL